MKSISKTTQAGLGPLIPAVLAPPEGTGPGPTGFYSAAPPPQRGATRNAGARAGRLRPAVQQAASG